MAYANIKYEGDSISLIYQIPFNYIDEEDIIILDSGNIDNTFTFINKQQIQLQTPIQIGESLLILRQTDIDYLLNYFNSASVLSGESLDEDLKQLLFAVQEMSDKMAESGDDITEFFTEISMNGNKIVKLGDADLDVPTDAANVRTVEKLIEKYNDGGAVTDDMIVAIAGQTDFILKYEYTMGINALAVFVAGARQSPIHITELTTNSFRIGEPCEGGEEVYALISDQPATSIEFPQATVDILGGSKVATIPQVDEKTNSETMITPATLAYAIGKIDVSGNVDNGKLPVDQNITDIAQGKYYVLDYFDMEDAPDGLKGAGIITKTNSFSASQGGLIVAYDSLGNMAVKVKTGTVWGNWKLISQNNIISTSVPSDDDGSPDGTFYYQIET